MIVRGGPIQATYGFVGALLQRSPAWMALGRVRLWRRHAHLRCIAERGRTGWQQTSGYGWRALVESDIARWKRIVGDGLRFQTDGRQVTEVAIAAEVLNRMLELGRPEYVRIA
ncbi:hypothetical protein [Belnapia moabensis]|uniref:hypothetical protein n=1 Tax=Belnapia moabensis TaxID=365533 RepID=UPI001B801A33|nr:hypothetical protein [Belnapia moabensis]